MRRMVLSAAIACGLLAALALTASANHSQTDLLSIGPNGGNGALDVLYGGASPDGSLVYFTTTESLVSADTDASTDVYERSETGTTTLISTGPNGFNGPYEARFGGVSSDGQHVFFETTEQLVSTDTDSKRDVYERYAGTTTLVSIGPNGGNTTNDSFYMGNSTDGTTVVFVSYDSLVSTDTDSSRKDVYKRSGGTVTQLSTGGNGPYGADFDGMTPDASHIYFHTDEALTGTDTDSVRDVYDNASGTLSQVSRGQINGNGNVQAFYTGSSQDGSRVFFESSEQLTSSDTDSFRDVYERSGGSTTLLSIGPNGGNAPYASFFGGASTDGTKVWFETRDPLVSSDTDGACEDSMGGFTLPCLDVFQRSGGTTTLISAGGNASQDASYAAGSQDGSHVFFHTSEALIAGDTDGTGQDVYDRTGGNTVLVSAGGTTTDAAVLAGISKDGARVFFGTYERLVPQDTDIWHDVYERYSGATTLISTGPASLSGDNIAFYDGASTDGTKVFFDTDERLTSADTDLNVDVYSNRQVVAGFPRPKAATPSYLPLVPAYVDCQAGSENEAHAPPLSFGSCNPPQLQSGVLTVGTPDANLKAANSKSSIKLRVVPDTPGPPDESDIQLVVTVNDVFCTAANTACPSGPLSDFTGKLLISIRFRISDKSNGSPPVEAATGQDVDFQVPLQCVATVTDVGGLCTTTTSVNSFYPGALTNGRRATWAIQDINVLDPGPNGTGFGACPPTCGDGDEAVFMRQGIFVP